MVLSKDLLNKFNDTRRKLYMVRTYLTIEKWAKRMPVTTVETTIVVASHEKNIWVINRNLKLILNGLKCEFGGLNSREVREKLWGTQIKKVENPWCRATGVEMLQ